jgi:hypothetical protein
MDRKRLGANRRGALPHSAPGRPGGVLQLGARLLLKGIGWSFALALAALLGLSLLIFLDRHPRVKDAIDATQTERLWASDWVAANRANLKRLDSIEFSAREASLLLNALLDKTGRGRGRIQLGEGRAHLVLSLRWPTDLLAGYLNIELELADSGPRPQVESARVARLPLPRPLVQTLTERALGAIDRAQVLRGIHIQPDRLRLSYAWRADTLARISGGLVPRTDLATVLSFQESLTRLTEQTPKRQPLQLANLLSHLLREAGGIDAADPVATNRALLLSLTAYVNGRSIQDPDSRTAGPPIRPRLVLLRGRQDLGQHFMTSAVLAIQGGDALSNLVGWYKEMSDSNGGSGFSFADLTANRAGIRFAKLATGSPAQALALQRSGAAGLSEDDFMPSVAGLPKSLTKAQFSARYGDSHHPQYQRLITAIDQRIESSRLYRPQ